MSKKTEIRGLKTTVLRLRKKCHQYHGWCKRYLADGESPELLREEPVPGVAVSFKLVEDRLSKLDSELTEKGVRTPPFATPNSYRSYYAQVAGPQPARTSGDSGFVATAYWEYSMLFQWFDTRLVLLDLAEEVAD